MTFLHSLQDSASRGQYSGIRFVLLVKVNVYLLKQQPKLPLRLAHPLAEAVGPLPHEESHLPVAVVALVGQRPGDQGFSRPRRTVKQTTPGERREYFIIHTFTVKVLLVPVCLDHTSYFCTFLHL